MNETTPPAPSEHRHAWLSVPMAVIIAAAMVSGSILFVGAGGGGSLLNAKVALQTPAAGDDAAVKVADPEKLVQADDPSIGNADAPVTIVEFSDFQCPYCRQFFNDTYGQLKKAYIDTGKVRLVFRDYPLPFHDAAKPSALAAGCANEQGKFWQFHDTVFAEQEKQGTGTVAYGIPELKKWAQQIGVDTAKFNQCLDSKKYDAEIEADIADGSAAGVSGTPSFFINGQLMVGAQPFSSFQALIDAEL